MLPNIRRRRQNTAFPCKHGIKKASHEHDGSRGYQCCAEGFSWNKEIRQRDGGPRPAGSSAFKGRTGLALMCVDPVVSHRAPVSGTSMRLGAPWIQSCGTSGAAPLAPSVAAAQRRGGGRCRGGAVARLPVWYAAPTAPTGHDALAQGAEHGVVPRVAALLAPGLHRSEARRMRCPANAAEGAHGGSGGRRPPPLADSAPPGIEPGSRRLACVGGRTATPAARDGFGCQPVRCVQLQWGTVLRGHGDARVAAGPAWASSGTAAAARRTASSISPVLCVAVTASVSSCGTACPVEAARAGALSHGLRKG